MCRARQSPMFITSRSFQTACSRDSAVCASREPGRTRTCLLLSARDRRYVGPVSPIPFTRLFGTSGRRAVESIVSRRTFDDVILPPATRRALDTALAQVTQHELIFNRWGLGER